MDRGTAGQTPFDTPAIRLASPVSPVLPQSGHPGYSRKIEARMGPGSAPFFVGRTADGAAVVLQHHRGRPVSLTLARFEADGTLAYGACGERETPFLECHAGGSEHGPGG